MNSEVALGSSRKENLALLRSQMVRDATLKDALLGAAVDLTSLSNLSSSQNRSFALGSLAGKLALIELLGTIGSAAMKLDADKRAALRGLCQKGVRALREASSADQHPSRERVALESLSNVLAGLRQLNTSAIEKDALRLMACRNVEQLCVPTAVDRWTLCVRAIREYEAFSDPAQRQLYQLTESEMDSHLARSNAVLEMYSAEELKTTLNTMIADGVMGPMKALRLSIEIADHLAAAATRAPQPDDSVVAYTSSRTIEVPDARICDRVYAKVVTVEVTRGMVRDDLALFLKSHPRYRGISTIEQARAFNAHRIALNDPAVPPVSMEVLFGESKRHTERAQEFPLAVLQPRREHDDHQIQFTYMHPVSRINVSVTRGELRKQFANFLTNNPSMQRQPRFRQVEAFNQAQIRSRDKAHRAVPLSVLELTDFMASQAA